MNIRVEVNQMAIQWQRLQQQRRQRHQEQQQYKMYYAKWEKL